MTIPENKLQQFVDILNIKKEIESNYPWWCITYRIKAWWFVRQLRKRRDAYRRETE